MKLVIAAALAFAGSAIPAFAGNGTCAEPPASPSVVFLGDPCDFVEPEVIAAPEESPTDRNVALIDARGLPTSMPVVMRPSVDAAPAVATTADQPATDSSAPAPAATEPPAAQPADAAPQETPPAEPVVQPDAPAASAPPGTPAKSNPEIQ